MARANLLVSVVWDIRDDYDTQYIILRKARQISTVLKYRASPNIVVNPPN
jgi:hypothetical protein